MPSTILDVDLSILGETSRRFDRYEVAIRSEYAWVPEATYQRERGRILARFAERNDLFTTPWFRRRCMTRAQANLRRAARGLAASHG